MSQYENDLRRIAGWLSEVQSCVVFTGAGISTESGIPDFRSPDGVWSRSRPVPFSEYLTDPAARVEYWRQKSDSHDQFVAATPNLGHLTIAHWEASGLVRGVITQNIDGLHQIAGSRSVLELHGSNRMVACLSCSARVDAGPLTEAFRATGQVPACSHCGGLLKHATVSFGQTLPEDVLSAAVQWSTSADLFLAIGSSLVVEPAASLPRLAAERGARLVIINRDATPADSLAQIVLRTSIGGALGDIAEHVVSQPPDDGEGA